MKKIAIFTEGESDMIFSAYLIKVIFGFDNIKIKYINRRTKDEYRRDCKPEEGCGQQYEFTIFNCGNDKRVNNSLKEDGTSMVQKGAYDLVFGLRDLGSEEYDKLAKGKIDSAITETMISNIRAVLDENDGVKIFFAVMELEAWYLALTACLERADYNLDDVCKKIGSDLRNIDPEVKFYDPKKMIKKFEPSFKEVDFAHKIGSKIEAPDIEAIKTGTKVAHFREYIEALESYKS